MIHLNEVIEVFLPSLQYFLLISWRGVSGDFSLTEKKISAESNSAVVNQVHFIYYRSFLITFTFTLIGLLSSQYIHTLYCNSVAFGLHSTVEMRELKVIHISFLFRKLILFAFGALHFRVVGQSAHCAVWRQGISATFSTIKFKATFFFLIFPAFFWNLKIDTSFVVVLNTYVPEVLQQPYQGIEVPRTKSQNFNLEGVTADIVKARFGREDTKTGNRARRLYGGGREEQRSGEPRAMGHFWPP